MRSIKVDYVSSAGFQLNYISLHYIFITQSYHIAKCLFLLQIYGLEEGLHGFHIHATGDLDDECRAAGGHFNPEGVSHAISSL